jgi:hypothetical protein
LPLHSLKKLVCLLSHRVATKTDPENRENKQGEAHHGQAPGARYSPEPPEPLRACIEEHGEDEAGEHEKEAARGAPDEEEAGSGGERDRHDLEGPPP